MMLQFINVSFTLQYHTLVIHHDSLADRHWTTRGGNKYELTNNWSNDCRYFTTETLVRFIEVGTSFNELDYYVLRPRYCVKTKEGGEGASFHALGNNAYLFTPVKGYAATAVHLLPLYTERLAF